MVNVIKHLKKAKMFKFKYDWVREKCAPLLVMVCYRCSEHACLFLATTSVMTWLSDTSDLSKSANPDPTLTPLKRHWRNGRDAPMNRSLDQCLEPKICALVSYHRPVWCLYLVMPSFTVSVFLLSGMFVTWHWHTDWLSYYKDANWILQKKKGHICLCC